MNALNNRIVIAIVLPPQNLSQLVREDNAVKNKTYVYTYDNAGNITSKKTYSLTSALDEPSGTPTTTTYGYSTGSWGDLLTSFNGSGITYDTIGNPLTYYGSRSFTWEGRRLVGATASSKSLTFKYNDEGLRTSKTVNGVTTNYYYNGSTLIAEETNGNITLYMYNSTGIVGFRYRTSSYAKGVWDTYLYEKNLQGDIVAVYDGNGTKKISYTYDAWGNFTATYHNGASATNLHNPYTYRGYYYDKDLSLYYLSSRYYDSNTGRFINADDVGVITATPYALTDKNLFAYCDNNPITRADNGGQFWHILIGAAVSATISAGIKIHENYKKGNPLSKELIIPILAGATSGALSASGAGIVTVIVGNAGIAMVENALCQFIYTDTFDAVDMLFDGVIGAVSGSIAGKGSGTKNLMNLGTQTVKRTFNTTIHKGLKSGLKEAGKAAKYYMKNTAKYYKEVLKKTPKDIIYAVGTDTISDYIKDQYNRIFGG